MTDNTNGNLDKVKEFAKSINDHSLNECLLRLKTIEERLTEQGNECETNIMNDFASKSFYFERSVNGKFSSNGGIIYHGKHDGFGSGSAPTFSVSITPSNGWQIHT